MGNTHGSSHHQRIDSFSKRSLIVTTTADEQLSATNNCSSSDDDDDSSSCASYTEFESSSPSSTNPTSLGSSRRRRSNSRDIHYNINNNDGNCSFLLPTLFRKKQNPLRILINDDHDNDVDKENGKVDRHDIPSTCWPSTTTRTIRNRNSISCKNNGKRNRKNLDAGLTDLVGGGDDTVDRCDNDDEDEQDEEYSCSPAAYLYKRSSSSSLNVSSTFANPTDTTSTTVSALETSKRRFYYCYPSGGTSLSKCKSAMTTPRGIPLFLDERTNSVSDWQYTQEELDMVNGDEPTDASNLQPPRRYWIVTTAALPWMTGTAVNPLLRAAYLSQRNRRLMQMERQTRIYSQPSADESDDDQSTRTTSEVIPSTVTLVLPWLEDPADREKLYGSFWSAPGKTCDDQESFIRQWLATSARLPLEAADPSEGGIAIQWYPARYHSALSSIFALGDLCEMIPTDDESDPGSFNGKQNEMICILEEPEHVNFYRAPGRESWRDRFGHVIGIVHTNYKAYARNHYSGLLTGPLVGALSSLMVRAYCDKVVKLSPVLQTYAPGKEVVSNVHGIRQEFFSVPLPSQKSSTARIQCYFIGKLLWAKGLDKLLDLEAHFRKKTGKYFDIDIVGSGPEQAEIELSFLGKHQKRAADQDVGSATNRSDDSRISHWRYFRQPIPARFLGRKDHAEIGPRYRIFVNPSITEVLCTTTAEAVAMAKWVIIPRHASNEFFLQFPNCLQYKTKNEFVELLQFAQANPVDHVLEGRGGVVSHGGLFDRSNLYAPLTWEAATERLIETAYLSNREARRRDRLTLYKEDKSIQDWHYTLGNGKSGDVLRKVLGGGPVAEQSTYKKLPSGISTSLSTPSLITVVQ